MRVISQKGIEPMVDLPYEQATLVVRENFIFATIGGRAGMLIARYATHENAKKAIESLLRKYEFPWEELNGRMFIRNPLFRFPEDSEL